MQASRHSCHALTAVALGALLAGCNGTGTTASTPPTATATVAHHVTSSSGDLLYATDWNEAAIFVFTYPDGAYVGTLSDDRYPLGMCSDASGNVFITNFGYADILEYAHGGSAPIKDFGGPGSDPRSCSVDPTTGNLAVVFLYPPEVVIFPNGSGSPQAYGTTLTFPNACTYDNQGNLYVDGNRDKRGHKFALAKLAKGTTQFVRYKVKGDAHFAPGAMQWDGSALALLGTGSPKSLYRIATGRLKGKVEQTITVDGPSVPPEIGLQFWIYQNTIIMPYGTSGKDINSIGFWNYPSGGSPIASLSNFGASELYGVTTSVSPSAR